MRQPVPEDHPLRRSQIDASDWRQVRFWIAEYGVSEAELLTALRAVGESADHVERYLSARASRAEKPTE